MTSWLRRWAAVALALPAALGLAAGAAAQTAPADGLAISSVDVGDYPDIRLTVTAPGTLVGTDLPASAFSLSEDGAERPVEVEQLANETLQVVLLLDTSGSMTGEPLEAVKQAAAAFVERMPEGMQIAVTAFATTPQRVSAFTTDHAATVAAIAGVGVGDRTSTYDAVADAVGQFADLPSGRRVIVLLSDGEDNQSTTTLDEAAELVAANDVSLHVVELETQFSDAAALRRLAEAGEGDVTSIDDVAALTASYDAIASKLLSQYRLSYRSAASGSVRVRVRIEHDGVRAEAVRALELPTPVASPPPPPPPPPEPDPAAGSELRILAVDTTAYPIVSVSVAVPAAVDDGALDASAFTLREDGFRTTPSVRPAGIKGRYLLTYRSAGHDDTELDLVLRSAEQTLRAAQSTTLPPQPWLLRLMNSPWGLAVGAFAVYASIALAVLLLLAPKPVRTTLQDAAWASPRRRGGLATVGDWAEERIEQALRSRGVAARLNTRLEQAGILLKPSEFVVVAVAAALVALAIGVLAGTPLVGLVLGGLVLFGSRIYLSQRVTRRRTAFTSQLGDTLQLLSGSLRAGYGLLQAVDAVAKDAERPTADEFRRVVLETRLGRDLGEALHALGERMGSDDLSWVIQAIDIHREVGGDLAEVLDRVGETIRDREQIARQVRSLSAEGRLSAKILIALPFVVMAGLSIINPGYLDELTGPGFGRALLAVAGLLMLAGALWINRLVRIEF